MLPIIIFHIGSQEYVPISLAQALKYNKRVILISDNTNNFKNLNIEHYDLNNYSKKADEFKSIYKHYSTGGYWNELICIQRWMYIESLMKELKIQRAFICDSDVLIYDNIDMLDKLHYKNWDVGLCTSESKNVTGGQSIWNYHKLKEFVEYCFYFYQKKQILAIEKWKNNYKENGGICDMTLLYYFVHGKKNFVGLRLPDYPYYEKDLTKVIDNEFTCDLHIGENGNHTSPHCYEIENGRKKISWHMQKPYCYNKELNKNIRFILLHCQGSNKHLIKQFFLNNN